MDANFEASTGNHSRNWVQCGVGCVAHIGRERVSDRGRETIPDLLILVSDGETGDCRYIVLNVNGSGDNGIDLVHLLSLNHDFTPVTERYLSMGGGQ
jgi:hypothetical protein